MIKEAVINKHRIKGVVAIKAEAAEVKGAVEAVAGVEVDEVMVPWPPAVMTFKVSARESNRAEVASSNV